MKVLYVTSKDLDHLSVCLWDGLQEILGEKNVVDASDGTFLHADSAKRACKEHKLEPKGFDSYELFRSIGASRDSPRLAKSKTKAKFDLLVVNSCFLRDFSWDWLRDIQQKWMKPEGKVVYVEGWDSPVQWHVPEISVDVVFRKEIKPGVAYPYVPHHLTFALPSRWFETGTELNERPLDVFFSGYCEHVPWRRKMLAAIWQSTKANLSVSSSFGLGLENYFKLLRMAKIGLCPSAADGADSWRTYEVIACGAIPLFIGYPDHLRNDWFTGEMCISCPGPDQLPGHLDEVLSHDLQPMRLKMWQHAFQYHTTAARANKLLQTVFGKQ